jgi:hypothetical protein
MAYITHHSAGILNGIWNGIIRFLESLGHSITMSATAQARFRRIEALNAKTDEELAEMRLRRADIPAYVFRDMMHI